MQPIENFRQVAIAKRRNKFGELSSLGFSQLLPVFRIDLVRRAFRFSCEFTQQFVILVREIPRLFRYIFSAHVSRDGFARAIESRRRRVIFLYRFSRCFASSFYSTRRRRRALQKEREEGR